MGRLVTLGSLPPACAGDYALRMHFRASRLHLLSSLTLLTACGVAPDFGDHGSPQEELGETQEALTGDAPRAQASCSYNLTYFHGGDPPMVSMIQNEPFDGSPYRFSLQLTSTAFTTCSGSIEVQRALTRNGQDIVNQTDNITCKSTDLCQYECPGLSLSVSQTQEADYGFRFKMINTFGPREEMMSCTSTKPVHAPQYRTVDVGYATLSRAFADVAGNAGADFCRFVGDSSSPFLACAAAKPAQGFGYQYEWRSAAGIDLGYADSPRVLADIDADGKADFCRFRGPSSSRYVTCDLAGPSGPSGVVWNSAQGVDLGYSDTPRVFVDVNGDQRADFCRFRGDPNARYITCDLAGPSGFVGTLNSAPGVDLGYSDTPRVFVDVNADGRADFCRFRGPANSRYITCDLATATGFQSEALKSPAVDLGYDDAPRLLGDVDNDDRADFCRFRGDPSNRHLQCNTSEGGAPFATVRNSFAGIAPGVSTLPSALVDVNTDGKADFCRFRTMNSRPYLQCNLANANLFETDWSADFRSAYAP
jgi:hypothetical protein